MTDHDDIPLDTPLATALLQHLHGAAEPADAGFSLRVMAALPARIPQRRRARVVRQAQWAAASLAACGAALLFSGGDAPLDLPHGLAALALMGLLIFWAIPSRWSRG